MYYASFNPFATSMFVRQSVSLQVYPTLVQYATDMLYDPNNSSVQGYVAEELEAPLGWPNVSLTLVVLTRTTKTY